MFNHRRQSQDRVLRRHILDRVGDAKLWMNGYSAKMFEKDESEQVRKCLIVDEDFLKKAAKGEYCFAESDPCGKDMFPDTTQVDSVILYKWNRVYPADQYFAMDLSGWKLVETVEFPGSSHEKITEEITKRPQKELFEVSALPAPAGTALWYTPTFARLPQKGLPLRRCFPNLSSPCAYPLL